MSAWTIDTVQVVKGLGNLPLPVQMRIAAEVIGRADQEYATRRGHCHTVWSARLLQDFANEWQEEDTQKEAKRAEKEALVDTLAAEMGDVERLTVLGRTMLARKLIDAGWRKAEKAS